MRHLPTGGTAAPVRIRETWTRPDPLRACHLVAALIGFVVLAARAASPLSNPQTIISAFNPHGLTTDLSGNVMLI